MSFKPTISDVVISNEALALLPAEPIASMEEPSLEGRECRRFYQPVVAEMLEEHHWDLAGTRAPLAETTNDRPSEWRYCYTRPDDMAYPIKLFNSEGSTYSGFVMQSGAFFLPNGIKLFVLSRDKIYSNIAAATLEYTSFNITEADFTYSFKKAVVAEYAARICMPITKDKARAQSLANLAEGYRQRAIARDLNRNQPTYGNSITESEAVRFGGMVMSDMGSGFAIDPVAFPSETG